MEKVNETSVHERNHPAPETVHDNNKPAYLILVIHFFMK
jgi:hypothetical protein